MIEQPKQPVDNSWGARVTGAPKNAPQPPKHTPTPSRSWGDRVTQPNPQIEQPIAPIDYSHPNDANGWWGHGSHDAWYAEHLKTLPNGGQPAKKGGCRGGCSGGGMGGYQPQGNPQMDALQKQLDAQLATLKDGELAFQKYLDQAEKDREATLAAQKKIDDEMARQQAEADAIEQERADRAQRGKRDLLRYVEEDEEDSNMLALGGQL